MKVSMREQLQAPKRKKSKKQHKYRYIGQMKQIQQEEEFERVACSAC